MEQLWPDEEDRKSLRDLAEHFNQSKLEAALEVAGVQVLDGEIENIYNTFHHQFPSEGKRSNQIQRILSYSANITIVTHLLYTLIS